VDVSFRKAAGAQLSLDTNRVLLPGRSLPAGDVDEEGYLFGERSCQWRDHPSLTVAPHADPIPIDAGMLAQQPHCRESLVCAVTKRLRVEVPGRPADARLVPSQSRNAVPREMVREGSGHTAEVTISRS
jgi:hypothetical protein